MRLVIRLQIINGRYECYVNLTQSEKETLPSSISYHDVEHDSHAPDVVPRPLVRDPLQDLRRSVSGAPAERLAQLTFVYVAGKAVIGQLDHVSNIQEDIFALQIPAVRKYKVYNEKEGSSPCIGKVFQLPRKYFPLQLCTVRI